MGLYIMPTINYIVNMNVYVLCFSDDKTTKGIDEITQEIIKHCATNVQNPVEILKFAQDKILTGRQLETVDTSNEIEGDTNFILVDRDKVMDTGFEEISQI